MRALHSDLMALLDELINAHYDTIEIALDTGCHNGDWAPHLTYLQELSRVARGVMAASAAPPIPWE